MIDADPERAVMFQSPNLLPWLSAKENGAVGVDKAYPQATQAERQDVVDIIWSVAARGATYRFGETVAII